MPRLTSAQWEEIARAYHGGAETLIAIAARFGIAKQTLQQYARRHGWPARGPAGRLPRQGIASPGTVAARGSLLRRLYSLMDSHVTVMEHRMQNRLDRLAKGEEVPPLEYERDTRQIGVLVKSIDQLTEIESDFARSADGKSYVPTADELFAEADRFRRELAERLAKFIPPSG
jgi:hypothetical protein